jgi:zinc protease
MQFNGTTWIDRTNYFEIFEANEDNLRWALEMEADRMVNSFIAKKDLDSEMTVVRNEFEQGENSPFRVLLKRMVSVAYDWHSYGRDTIGNRSDIENVNIPHLQAFYRTYYQPDNAVLLVAGKFDEAKTLALVAKNFGAIPRPTRTLPVFWTVEPTQDGERTFTVRRKGVVQVVALAYHVPSGPHDDSDAVGFAAYILGQAHRPPAQGDRRERRGLAGVQLPDAGRGARTADVWRRREARRRHQQGPTRWCASSRLRRHPPEAGEIQRTRQSFANQAEKALANHESLGVQMSEYIALGDWRLFFLARDELDKMDAARVQAAAKKYFRRDNRTVGFFLPEDNPQRAEIPATPTLAEVMKDFKPKQDTTVSESFDPSQDNINKRTKRFEVDGIKVALLSKKNRGETVNVAIAMRIGNEGALRPGDKRSARQPHAHAQGKFTREQLSDTRQLKISGRISGPGGGCRPRVPTSMRLRLVAHVLRNPPSRVGARR